MTFPAKIRSYSTGQPKVVETPYMRAKREWDSRLGSAVVQSRNWRLCSFCLAAMLATSLAGNIYVGAQSKVVPHIVEVDSLGEAVYRGPVTADLKAPSEAVVRFQLRRFLDLVRTVSSDKYLLRRNWLEAYKMLSPTGSVFMTEWLRSNDPFARADQETTAIELTSAVPLTEESWQLDWRESAWDRSGKPLGSPVAWRAMIKIRIQPPANRQQLSDNPIGLFIDELHWDQITGQPPEQ